MDRRLALAAATDAPEARAAIDALAARLGVPVTSADDDRYGLLLVLTRERLELRETGSGGTGPVYADFVAGRMGYRRRTAASAGKSMLAKAVGFRSRPLTVCDATAGL